MECLITIFLFTLGFILGAAAAQKVNEWLQEKV